MEAPVTLPVVASAKSLASTPVTLSLNVTVKLTLVAFVGLAAAAALLMEATVGAVTSHVTVPSVDVDTLLVFPARSETPAAGIVAITVPLVVMPLTATVNVVPLFGAISVIVAVLVPPAVP